MYDFLIFPRLSASVAEQRDLRSEMTNHPPDAHPELWFTREQVADMLGFTTRTVDRYRANGLLSYCRGGVSAYAGSVRFWRADIMLLRQPEAG